VSTARVGGRVALVTGAGSPSGIGFATARLLGRDGASVALASTTDRIHDREMELGREGFDSAGFVANLTVAVQVRSVVTGVLARFGRIDVLVNNAGMVRVGEEPADMPFEELTEASWDRDIALNLKTAFNVTREVVPHMLGRGFGRVVNVSSVTGPLVANPRSTGYAAAKAGMDGFTRGLAIEVARRGITVNSVAPGWIETGSSTEEELVAGRNTRSEGPDGPRRSPS
jgi:3-oxoacyl-[acyl-carrier protein] reductase